MNTLVPISSEDGRTLVSGGADRVMHFLVYERKIKEGNEVIKVRLVCNGKVQHGAGKTYAPTPSRVEMYVLLEIVEHYSH
jgi:hypothetical protein